MTDGLRWYERGDKRLPLWLRTSALLSDGTVYVAAALAGEANVILCAEHDGTPIVEYRGHPFVSAQWLKQEFPDSSELVEKIEHATRDFFR